MENELARGFYYFLVENCSSVWKKDLQAISSLWVSDEQIIILTILDAKPHDAQMAKHGGLCGYERKTYGAENAFNAVLLGALMIYGLQPGPLLITKNPDLFWGVVGSMYIGNVMLVILNLPLIPLWVRVLKIPANLLSVLILLFCFLGSYSINNSLTDVVITFAFGVIGYVLKRLRFETPPLILAFVLGPLIEVAFRQSMIGSDGSFMIFITRPISAFFLLATLGIIVTAFIKKRTFASTIEGEA